MKKTLVILFIGILFFGCSKSDKSSTNDPIIENIEAAEIMNENLQLPSGTVTVNPDDLEKADDVTLQPDTGEPMQITTGETYTTNIAFNAPNGNVTHAGIRFGDSGLVNMVPLEDLQGVNNGTLNFPFSISQGTCSLVNNLCHPVRRYGYAMTSDGKITSESIMDVVLICGPCDEPSCYDYCCNPGEYKIISNDILIDSDLQIWSVCNNFDLDNSPDSTVSSIIWIGNSFYNDSTYSISLIASNTYFYEGQVISSFSPPSYDFSILLESDINIYLWWSTISYSGSSQGTVVINELTLDNNQDIVYMRMTFNNMVCENIVDGSQRKINGSITAIIQ